MRPVADGVANAREECCVASVAKRVWVGSRRVRGARRPARVCAFFCVFFAIVVSFSCEVCLGLTLLSRFWILQKVRPTSAVPSESAIADVI